MSAVYPTFKGTLLTWLFGGGWPTDAELKVAGVSGSYVYNATHSVVSDFSAAQLFGDVLLTGTVSSDGTIDADDVEVTGVTPGPTLDALIVYAEWTGGTALVCYIDSSSDASLPIELTNTEFGIRFNALGICRI